MFLLPDLTSVVHLLHVGKCEKVTTPSPLHVGKQREGSTQEPGGDSDPG